MKRNRNKKSEFASGTVRIHPRGFGFLIPQEREKYPEDIFIPRHATKGAVDGDFVEVRVSPYFTSEKGPEGRIVKVLKRGRSHVAGIITYIGRKDQIYAYVPLLGEDQMMRILPSEEHRLNRGDRIIVHVLDWGSKKRECLGEMSAYIGHISDPLCDIVAAIEEFELEENFSREALKEAKAFGDQVSPKEIEKREDFRDLECFTIDPETAKDFDDALSLSQDKQGNFYLGVHIADVSHYVKPHTLLDQEACGRCNSVYFPGYVIPMLPHELSSNLCSLKPDVNRLAISVMIILDKEGTLKHYTIKRSVIKSKKRFSYGEAKLVLDGKLKSKHTKTLFLMVDLCHRLKRKRYERGCIEFALPDLSIELSKEGEVKKFNVIEYDITHQLVEEFMLLANEIVATHLSKEGKPLTYRIHEEPNPENIKDFAQTASAIGFPLSEQPTTEELQKLFDEARQTPFGQFLATSFIRSMKLASYSTQNIGHFGLGLDHYTHFTSPIRRYIDLIVHRLLFDEMNEEQDLEQVAIECSERERLSAKAEQSVILLKKLRYLSSLPNKTFEAVITSVKPQGLVFELKDIMYESFLFISPKGLHMGDQILVKLVDVDLITRRTEWIVISGKKTKRKVGLKP